MSNVVPINPTALPASFLASTMVQMWTDHRARIADLVRMIADPTCCRADYLAVLAGMDLDVETAQQLAIALAER